MDTAERGAFFDTEVTEDGVEVTEQKEWGLGRERFPLCALRLGLNALCVSTPLLWLRPIRTIRREPSLSEPLVAAEPQPRRNLALDGNACWLGRDNAIHLSAHHEFNSCAP